MKILHVSSGIHPLDLGGVERVVSFLSRECIKKGCDVTVLSPGKKDIIKHLNGIRIIKRKRTFKMFRSDFSFGLFNILRILDADVVHVHSPAVTLNIAVLISKLKEIPCILTLHNLETSDDSLKKIFIWIYKKLLLNVILKFVDFVVIPSEKHLEDEQLKRFSQKVNVIPNGIFIRKTKKQNQKKEFTVLTVSKLDKTHRYKGIKYLIQAMKKIKDLPIKLAIVGEGRLKKRYLEYSKNLGVSQKVKFVGYVNDEELNKWYSKADCFVLSSTSKLEGFGLVVLEALSFGVPVIVSNIAGVSTWIKKYKAGIIINPKKPDEISDSIKSLYLNKKLRETLQKKSLQMVRNFTWDKVAKEYFQLYKISLG